MLAVLSPAKTLDMDAASCKLRSSPTMQTSTKELLPVVRKLTAADLKTSMGISHELAKLNAGRYAKFDAQASKQACLAFDGPAYRGMHAEDFTEKEQKFAQAHIRILSGLYGVLRPYDAIKPYRLEMGVKISTRRGLKVLVNCASQEYWKAVRPKALPPSVRVVTCDFPGPSVFAKKARGMMCRHIVKSHAASVEDLKKFKGEGADRYAFSAAKSSASKLVFLRSAGVAGGGGGQSERSGAKKRPMSSMSAAGGRAMKRSRA